MYNAYVRMVEIVASGATAASGTVTGWQPLPINTKSDDPSTICTLGTNQFVLTAGTYRIQAIQSFGPTNASKIRLFNATAGTTLVDSIGAYPAGSPANAVCTLGGRFTIAAAQNLQLQYHITLAGPLGYTAYSGDSEIYTNIELWRES
jgi:hypothetical protein